MTRKAIIITTSVALIFSLLFPPWGFRNLSVDHFGFVFRQNPSLHDYPGLEASIAWPFLGIELAVITLIAIIAYLLAKR